MSEKATLIERAREAFAATPDFPDFSVESRLTKLESRLSAIETALAKQRAVNEPLLEFFGHGYGLNDTIAALREALK